MGKLVMYAGLIVGVTALMWGYMEANRIAAVWALGGIGLLWLIALLLRRYRAAGAGLLMSVTAAGFGVWLDLSMGWMVAGVLGALINWDLANFAFRLQIYSSEDDPERCLLERSRLARLAIVTLVGLALASGAMVIQSRFSFEWALFLTLAGVWSIAQLLSWLRKGSE